MDPPVDESLWEQVFGPTQPLGVGDVPVLANDLCRARWVAVQSVLAFDVPQAGGWVEWGRIAFYHRSPTVAVRLAAVRDVLVEAWTPERATVRVELADQAASARLYVTLARGWTGPRLDLYVWRGDGQAAGADMLLTRLDAGGLLATGANIAAAGSDDTAWAATGPQLGVLAERHVAATPYAAGQVTVALVGLSPTHRAGRAVDQGGNYPPAAANAVLLTQSPGENPTSLAADRAWLGGQVVATGPGTGGPTEAEQIINAGATTTLVAGGGGESGQAVRETQTAQGAATLVATAAQQPTQGRYAIYVRARLEAVGTGNLQARTAATTGLPAATYTNAAVYGWVGLGEVVLDGGPLSVFGWGTVAQRLDRVALVPMELRSPAAPSWSGVRDQAAQALIDSRPAVELVVK